MPRPQPPLDQEASWHSQSLAEILEALQTDSEHGLSPDEVEKRRAQYGPNVLTRRKGPSWFTRLLSQFSQPLVLILIVAGAVTAAFKEWVDAGVIFGVVIINATVGYLQETKAVKAIEALSRAMTIQTTVIRQGRRVVVSASDLVPGDVVNLQAGDKVPADLRLIYLRELRVDESTLTGESLPVEKRTEALPPDTVLTDRANMVYATTLVAAGQGTGVVVATGDNTEVGRISHLIAEAEQLKTPLTRKIAAFSKLLLYVIIGLAAVTALVGILRGQSAFDMFMAAVALAVGAIPEGLPAAVTITLAIGVSRMARRRAIIRKLPAVETLGSTTVICSDKTGTLTENQMTVQELTVAEQAFFVTGVGYKPEGWLTAQDGSVLDGPSLPRGLLELLRAGVLCNDSSLYQQDGEWHIGGDPTEGALLVVAAKAGVEREEVARQFPRLDTLPFESEHRYMATLHALDTHQDSGSGGSPEADRNGRLIYVKGALEKILARCHRQLTLEGNEEQLEPERIEALARKMAEQGLRVLAFAKKNAPFELDAIDHDAVRDRLVFLGLQGMIDPPRAEAIAAIQACHTAGIQVKMITGDHVLTAAAIASQLGLRPPGCSPEQTPRPLTGAELAQVEDQELPQVAEETFVFARVSPEQKLRLVTALQSRGHVVAMTGDGVNDGPALRQADIGVAMGRAGTEVAKEAADMVLTDDNFATIEAAVEEGRGVFDNLTKFITWTLPTNLGEGLVILAAIFAGLTLAITPVQILWINMTTAVLLGLMLAFEAKEEGIMSRPPRSPKAPILDRVLLGRIAIVGVLLLIGAFGLFEYAQSKGYTVAEARTVANNVFVFGEIFYLFSCRSLTAGSWKAGLRTNRLLWLGVGIMIALQLLYTYLPGMNTLFETAPIPAHAWLWILGVSLLIHVIIEIEKFIRRRLKSRPQSITTC